jgi:hypothetical protein
LLLRGVRDGLPIPPVRRAMRLERRCFHPAALRAAGARA